MPVEEELTQAMLDGYQRAGEEADYWGTRFLQAVRRNGGLSTAKRMLRPRTTGQRQGLDALLNAGRPDLTVEAIILQPHFSVLFTQEELAEATRRLGEYGKEVARRLLNREHVFPDEVPSGRRYIEGSRRQVRVNAYERDVRARAECLRHYGCTCSVCDLNFEQRYGDVGRDFIHVHHLKPLFSITAPYELEPIRDLRPVCPNCHAMLHRHEPMLTIEELRKIVTRLAG